MSETKHVTIMKFIIRHKLLFGCLLLMWLGGMIFTLNLMGRSAHTKVHLEHNLPPLLHPLQHNRLPPPYSFKMARANHYCNPPNNIAYNQEGRVPTNYSLIFLASVIRHGDRSPMRPIRNQSIIDCGSEEHHPLLKKFQVALKVVPRHWKKLYPFSTFPLQPSEKHCSSSQMTIIGIQQHLQLGYQMGKVYNKHLKLLTKDQYLGNFKVYSTIYSRTFQSALAFLFGFLPDFNLNKLKIAPSSDIRFCMNKEYCTCPALEYLQKVMDKKHSQLVKSHPAVVFLIERLSPIVKLHPNHSDISSPMAMFDSLMGYVCHGSHLPCIPNSHNCVTIDHVRNIMAFLEWEGRQFIKDATHRKQSWLKMQGFLVNLVEHMQRSILKPNSERFVLYSGHDVTLMPLASVLGYDDGIVPPYASRLNFEIYAGENNSKHIIKLIYNGKDITKYTPFCEKIMKSGVSYVCPLENFVQFVHKDFKEGMNVSVFSEACTIASAKADEYQMTYNPFKGSFD